MIDSIKRYVQEQNMFAEGDYVVAGVSGGADSICLLCVLLELRLEIPMTIHVVHINHKIREEAGEDAAYVEAFCRERRLPFSLVEADVEQLAAQRHISTEEAGREVRYEAFHRILNENRAGRRGRIAIAHNQNDCCETFLFHLFRGSGLKGLTGIPAIRGEIVRPLLHTSRTQIERYLAQKGIQYCIDRTNLEDNYTRNRIRHHILQTACEEVSANATEHIQEACDKISDAYTLIEDMTRQGWRQCIVKDEKGIHILADFYLALHTTIQGYVMMEALAQAAGSRKDLETVHVQQLQELLRKQPGRRVDLPYSVRAIREYAGIRLEKVQSCDSKDEPAEYGRIPYNSLHTGTTVTIETQEGYFELSVLCTQQCKTEEIPSNMYTKWLDYDKIIQSVVFRTRRSGDYLTIDDNFSKKSLKKYMIEEKIPANERNSMMVLADGNHIIWVPGGRISTYYRVTEQTRVILEVTCMEKQE